MDLLFFSQESEADADLSSSDDLAESSDESRDEDRCVCVYALCRYILVYVCFCNMFGLLGHNNFMVYSPQFSQQLL